MIIVTRFILDLVDHAVCRTPPLVVVVRFAIGGKKSCLVLVSPPAIPSLPDRPLPIAALVPHEAVAHALIEADAVRSALHVLARAGLHLCHGYFPGSDAVLYMVHFFQTKGRCCGRRSGRRRIDCQNLPDRTWRENYYPPMTTSQAISARSRRTANIKPKALRENKELAGDR